MRIVVYDLGKLPFGDSTRIQDTRLLGSLLITIEQSMLVFAFIWYGFCNAMLSSPIPFMRHSTTGTLESIGFEPLVVYHQVPSYHICGHSSRNVHSHSHFPKDKAHINESLTGL